jgi:hypothetical protein
MARESQARMSTAYGYPYDDPTSTFQCRGAGAKQYARIQGHLYEHAAAADAVRHWILAQPIHTLLFGAALSFFKALTRELEDSPIARVPCDG